MEWFKKHVDTVIVLGSILSSMIWINGKFSDVDKKFSEVEKDLAVIKTVLVLKNIMPTKLCEAKEK